MTERPGNRASIHRDPAYQIKFIRSALHSWIQLQHEEVAFHANQAWKNLGELMKRPHDVALKKQTVTNIKNLKDTIARSRAQIRQISLAA